MSIIVTSDEEIWNQLQDSNTIYVNLCTHIVYNKLHNTYEHEQLFIPFKYFSIRFDKLSDTRYAIQDAFDSTKHTLIDYDAIETPDDLQWYKFIQRICDNNGTHPIIEEWLFAGTFK